MQSDILQAKHSFIFDLLDVDQNGFIEKTDFINIAESLCVVRGETMETEEANEILSKCLQLWEGIAHYIDEDADQRCSFTEWERFITKHLVNSEEDITEKYLKPMVRQLFELYDQNNDGYISLSEFLDIFLSFDLKSSLVGRSFRLLDRNQDNAISKAELVKAVSEFIASDNLDDPGNFIFGNIYDK